jgi:hypothetical protein
MKFVLSVCIFATDTQYENITIKKVCINQNFEWGVSALYIFSMTMADWIVET